MSKFILLITTITIHTQLVMCRALTVSSSQFKLITMLTLESTHRMVVSGKSYLAAGVTQDPAFVVRNRRMKLVSQTKVLFMETNIVHSGLNGLIITLQSEKAPILATISLWRVTAVMFALLTESQSLQAGALKVNGSSLTLLSLIELLRL